MTKPEFRSWQSVHDEVLRRIHTRAWKPGEMIPHEADLAAEFGCARATVNRALRQIAATGLLDRRRKAGTRVAEQPVAKATLDIAVIRQEVEARGQRYRHQLIDRCIEKPPAATAAAMGTDACQTLLHLRALHMADTQPYALEDRWVNLAAVPDAAHEEFAETSSNEWLLKHAPYTHGEISFSAANVSQSEADALDCAAGAAVFVLDRLTWNGSFSVTKVRLVFAEGHAMRAVI
ncbi:MAG: GntR family transcriptional regulator [Pseudomonadota bacterium]